MTPFLHEPARTVDVIRNAKLLGTVDGLLIFYDPARTVNIFSPLSLG